MRIPISLLGNGSLENRYRGNEYTRKNRIVESIVFYAVRVAGKESTRLVLPIISCLKRQI
jgi:hypothetical protein